MKEFPWENKSLSPLTRRELLEKAYLEFVENPFWQAIQRHARGEVRHGKDQTTLIHYSNDQIRFAQGQLHAWDRVPNLAVEIYEAEDAELEREQYAENLPTP